MVVTSVAGPGGALAHSHTDDLPDFLAEVAGLIGMQAALTLAEAKGGELVYIPSNPKADHWLSLLIGSDAANVVGMHFSQTSFSGERMVRIGYNVTVPLAAQFRKWTLFELCCQEGLSGNETARRVGVHIRTVRRWHAKRRQRLASKAKDAKMLITRGSLDAAFTGFSTKFNEGFKGAPTVWPRIATSVPSAASENTYGWLGQFAPMREWIGPRNVRGIVAHGYTVANRKFEQAISIKRDDLEDDKLGIFAPMFSELGRSAAEKPDELVLGLLKNGFTGKCYDGQNFFDSDHPVEDESGELTTVSNVQAGSGAPWFLLDTSRMIRPLIYQERRPLGQLVKKDRPEDDNVFLEDEYIYGSDGRCNAGYGLWQMAFGSKATLNAENYSLARAAMSSLKGDAGRPLNILPNILVCGPALEEAARKLLNSELISGGESNPWKGTAELIVTSWVA